MFSALQNVLIPDPWQMEAISALRGGSDVIIDAPTGAGKTFVFEKFVEGGACGRKTLYTVPTRALANDKFAEWRSRGWRTGIMTGDVSHATDAPVVVATLEAAQGALGDGTAARTVVIDEYQWIADPNRGNHYEGAIISLPSQVQLLLLSGCVANPDEIGEWLRRLGRAVRVVRHAERPVPIEEVDLDDLARRPPAGIEGYWPTRIASALREDLGPILVFAPHRQDAEKLARQLARALPAPDPLALADAQRALLSPGLEKLLQSRIAYHHSGLSYEQRAGVIEPLAKAGQLRVVVATLGLSAGINFSLRSVLITRDRFSAEGIEYEIAPHDLLQMIGRAGRRGLDETGYLLACHDSPRLGQARPLRLRRAPALPWASLLRLAATGENLRLAAPRFAASLLTREPPRMGVEHTALLADEDLPCHLATDTGRARLVRRTRRPFRGCATCPHRADCLSLPPDPSLLWQWTRIGLIDRELRLTERGLIASFFLGPEGLAVAAAVEDPLYPTEDLLLDLANLFAGERFCGDEPRWSGRLAIACNRAYGRFSIEGYLTFGIPPQYGAGGASVLRELLEGDRRRGQLTTDHSGIGDIDRLLTDWRSLLRQITGAPETQDPRWSHIKALAAERLGPADRAEPPIARLPQLGPDQRRPISHRLRWTR
ncbi:MAG: DEAD/DEAH box helicase [Verrucomicrobiae bacterium]|nr:DEAD/DEAH box helicase [Verrucomicrobiae bacterium]